MRQDEPGRLSDEQWQLAQREAVCFRDRLVKWAAEKNHDGTTFYPELFRVAAELIEKDADDFCDHAEAVFEEIDAYGQEPLLDDDWLAEVTGEKDSFYFSTDSLVNQLPPLPGNSGKGRQVREPDETAVVMAVEEAIAKAEDALAVAHHENPADWIQKIEIALTEHQGVADFQHLLRSTGLSPGALFLGLLLGQDNWRLGQKEFYGDVMVELRKSAVICDQLD